MAKKRTKKVTNPVDNPVSKNGLSGVTASTKRRLASISGNLCANPDCNTRLVDPQAQNDIGEAAHIVGEKKGAARFDPKIPDQQKNDIHNLLYLCANCHTIIDSDKEGKRYSIELLTKWKTLHEKKVRHLLSEGFAVLNFPELEEATNWLLARIPKFGSGSTLSDFRLIEIKNKIAKHALSNESQHIIVEACSRLDCVEQFIEERNLEDTTPPPLPERLKAGILSQYYSDVTAGQVGDDLFTSMVEYMRRGFTKYEVQSASLAILVYFFEKCDIFSD